MDAPCAGPRASVMASDALRRVTWTAEEVREQLQQRLRVAAASYSASFRGAEKLLSGPRLGPRALPAGPGRLRRGRPKELDARRGGARPRGDRPRRALAASGSDTTCFPSSLSGEQALGGKPRRNGKSCRLRCVAVRGAGRRDRGRVTSFGPQLLCDRTSAAACRPLSRPPLPKLVQPTQPGVEARAVHAGGGGSGARPSAEHARG